MTPPKFDWYEFAPQLLTADQRRIKMLRALANRPDGIEIHELFDQLGLTWDEGVNVLPQLLDHGFAKFKFGDRPKTAGGPLQATKSGRSFLARRARGLAGMR